MGNVTFALGHMLTIQIQIFDHSYFVSVLVEKGLYRACAYYNLSEFDKKGKQKHSIISEISYVEQVLFWCFTSTYLIYT